jgi:hypothetical protein
MKKYLLHFLQRLGLLAEVPETLPSKGKVLARSVCFLHDGADNPNAFLLYADGFVCTTNQCHHTMEFGHNLEGLIRLMVHKVTNKVMPWKEAWRFAQNNVDLLKELIGERVRHACGDSSGDRIITWSREDLADCLKVPDAYYLGRGFRPETLEFYGVGTCVRPLPDGNDRLLGWSIIPVLDWGDPRPLGYTARNPRWVPGGAHPKWHHAVSRSQCLFNMGNFWPGSDPLIICEGPGCVMRFREAGLLSAVATLGASLSDRQYGLFMCVLYHQQVYIAADADEAGRQFAENVKKRIEGICLREPRIVYPPETKDFGDMTPEQIRAMSWERHPTRGIFHGPKVTSV